MSSSKEYLHFILEQPSDLEVVSYRSMMGKFILYYRGKCFIKYILAENSGVPIAANTGLWQLQKSCRFMLAKAAQSTEKVKTYRM